ncbi:diguanylate cyclase/phosphodiesterase [Nitrosospira sp. Nl5]|nr:diguanylate cyclase/phosphodiesterase [Nitrosospira sp. Nl5]
MSLFRQLWLAVILVTLTSFIGSFAVSMHSTRSYLEQQLHRKNIDSANFLALTISQLSKDPVTIALQIAALFDSGQYESISITSPDGKVIAERMQDRIDTTIPEWFIDFFPISAEAGRAQISDSWMQFGVIKVVSHTHLAYQALWEQTENLILWFLVTGTFGGLIGVLILYRIKRPLAAMVDQADAITERRFLTISEPRVPELRSIARATNDLVRRLHNRFFEETSRLEALHKQLNYNAVTGLANRKYFMSRANTLLHEEDAALGGVLLIIRLNDLAKLNRKFDRTVTNNLLGQVGTLIDKIASEAPDRLSARLNGSDFALIIPDMNDAGHFAKQLTMELTALLPQTDGEITDFCHIGAIHYQRGDKLDTLLANADAALATASKLGTNAWHAAAMQSDSRIDTSGRGWGQNFTDAISENRLKLVLFPVVGATGTPLHQEAVIRLQVQRDGDWLAAGDFMATTTRLNLTGSLDLGVFRLAIEMMHSQSGELAVNLSAETMADQDYREKLAQLLRQHPDLCRRLWIEVPEYGAFNKFETFRDFCHTFKELGCRLGLEHFGHHFGEIQKLTDLGLDYLKVDASFVYGIDQKKGQQKFLKGLCGLAHSVGIIVIAIGVQTETEQKTLIRLGFDGVTGPGVK